MELIQNILASINTLSTKPEETHKSKFKNDLLELIVHLDDENSITRQEILTTINSILLSCCQFYAIHNSDFQVILQNMNVALINLYEQNTIRAQTKCLNSCGADMDNYMQQLWKENTSIIKCFKTLINHFNTIDKLNINYILTAPLSVATILYKSFKQIADSKNIFNNLMESFEDVLKMLYNECCDLQVCYFTFLQSRFHFNCGREDEAESLNEVLEKMADTGSILLSLDIKAMADHWKNYLQLLQTYAGIMKDRVNIAKPITCICHKIEIDLKMIIESSSVKDTVNVSDELIVHTLKVDNFLLKIIIKVCESFNGYLGNCYSELLQLITMLLRYSTVNLKYISVSKHIAEKIEMYASTGADPLLKQLVEDRAFAKVYIQTMETISVFESDVCDILSVILLFIAVFKILLHLSEDVRNFYVPQTGSYSILTSLFSVLTKAEIALCTDVNIPLSRNGIPHTVHVYDGLLIVTSSFVICTVSSEQNFAQLEELLIKYTFSVNPLVALFAVDLWSNIARYGNADLRYIQVQFLLQILNSCTLDDFNVQGVINLRGLTKRLFSFLPYNHKIEFMNFISLKNLASLYTLYEDYPISELKTDISTKLLTEITSDLQNFINKSDQLSNECVLKLYCMSVINVDFISDKHKIVVNDVLINLWHILKFKNPTDDKVIAVIYFIFNRFILFVDHKFLLEIFQQIQSTIIRKSSYVKLAIIDLLTILDKLYLDDSVKKEIISSVSLLYRQLLLDNNPLIQQRCLESFVYVAHATQYDEIILHSVSCSDSQKLVQNYLQKIPPIALERTLLQDFIARLYAEIDKVSVINNVDDKSISERGIIPTKKFKVSNDTDITNTLREINCKLEMLSSHFLVQRPNWEQENEILRSLQLVNRLKHNVELNN